MHIMTQYDDMIRQYIAETSGYEPHRQYLGMSQISMCARRLYREFLYGTQPTDRSHYNAKRGYMFEAEIKQWLVECGIIRPATEECELVADFDTRFRGHTDGETIDGALLEIKSISEEELFRTVQNRRVQPSKYTQCQAYMRYGRYRECVIVLVSTATLSHLTVKIFRSDEAGRNIEKKAMDILRAIDARKEPACECGKCQ